ncbi:hypothetical protein Tco_0475891 [Tanacetum coccineum]
MRAPLYARFKDLPTSDIKEILLQRMLEENYDKGHKDHQMTYKALQISILHDESEQFDADKAKEPQDMVSDDEDIGSRHIPRVNLNQDWFKPLSKDERPVTPEPAWSIPSSSLHVPIHNRASALASSYLPLLEDSLLSQTEGPAYEVVKAFHPDVIHLQFQMEECHKLLTNQVDDRLLKYNISRPLLLGGPPSHVTIQTEFFFNKDLDYLRFGSKGDKLALSITKMKALYYPNIRNLVIRKRVKDFQLGIESYQTQLNLTKPCWVATGLEFIHDYKILDSPRAVVFRYKYGMHMIMCFNEIHKFSDGTLQQIDEALDYRVKEFRVNKVNPRLNTRFWTTNDVIKSKKFMFAIQKRLKLRKIFRNLERFVGGSIREGDYRLLQRTE